MPTAPFMCLNGDIVPYQEAQVHAFSGVVKYGAGVFEGMRAYWSEADSELYIFRLEEHLERLRFGMAMMRFDEIYDLDWLAERTVAMLRANDLRETCHIRVIAYLDGDDELAATGPTGFIAGAVPRGSSKYVSQGMHMRVSSWRRIADNAMPARVKCTGNYVNNRAAELEARRDDFEGSIMLTEAGKVSEGTGACLFMLRNGVLYTPDITSDILESVTRATMIDLARDQGMTVVERAIDRTELHAAQEIFMCGSGWEVVPVLSVDRMPVGTGEPGPVTQSLSADYFATVRGEVQARRSWLTPVWQAEF